MCIPEKAMQHDFHVKMPYNSKESNTVLYTETCNHNKIMKNESLLNTTVYVKNKRALLKNIHHQLINEPPLAIKQDISTKPKACTSPRTTRHNCALQEETLQILQFNEEACYYDGVTM